MLSAFAFAAKAAMDETFDIDAYVSGLQNANSSGLNPGDSA